MSIQPDKRTGPLNGYKILDFTRVLGGPYGTMLLGDLGATVIKVEQPTGDTSRGLGPYLNNEDKDMGLGGFNNSINRNKKSIALDLKQPEAQKVAQKLAAECDVLMINFSSPAIMQKYQLDYDTVKKINPKIVYVSMSGYGTSRVCPTCFEGKPTIDLMMQAESGLMSVTGSPDGKMYKVGPGIGDTYSGTVAIVALLAALVHAKDTGVGQFVDISMLDSMVMLSERIVYQYSYTGISPKPLGNRHPLQSPYSLYPTKDGTIVIAGEPSRYWDRLVEAMDISELRNDPRFFTKESRLQNEDAMDVLIEGWTKAHTTNEAMAILDEHGCLTSALNKAGDLFNNKQIEAREMLVEVEGHPRTGEKVKIVGTPMKFSDTPAKVYHRAPLIGENSIEIMQQLGYGQEEIQKMLDNGTLISTKL